MRYMTASLFVAAIGIGACNRPAVSPAADANQQLATPASAATAEPKSSPEAAPTAAPAAAVGSAEQAPAAAERAPEVTWREITIPAGTSLPIVLDTPVASDTSEPEGPVAAHLARAIVVKGETVVPKGSRVSGVITDATRAAKVKGRASIAMRFETLTPEGGDERYQIQTGPVVRTAAATKKDDTVKILAPAVGGAILGRIVGGRKGAAIGAGTGAGAGTAVVMGTRGKEVGLGKGAALTLRLTQPLTVRIRG